MTARTVFLPAGPGGDPPRLAVDAYGPDAPGDAAVLFVHGFASRRDGEKQRVIGAHLAARGISMLAPDLQGHGDSGGSIEDLTIERSMADVLRVAEAPAFREARRHVLVGSSLGGVVAAWLTVERPDLAHALVLIAPAFRFLERHLAVRSAEEIEAWRQGAPLRLTSPWVDVRLSNRLLEEAPRRTTGELARRLAVPTTIVHGRQDESVPWRESVLFAEASGRGDLDVLLLGDGDHRLAAHADLLAEVVERATLGVSRPLPPAGRA